MHFKPGYETPEGDTVVTIQAGRRMSSGKFVEFYETPARQGMSALDVAEAIMASPSKR